MASKEARERKLKEIQEVAEGWGKIVAREAQLEGLSFIEYIKLLGRKVKEVG